MTGTKQSNLPPSVGFVALGCPKNKVDSEVMLAHIGQAGLILSADPDQADVVIINTCGFIAPAKEEALSEIRRAIRQKKRGKVCKVIVAGCLSQRMGYELLKEVPQIDALVGLDQRDEIVSIIQNVLRSKKESSHSRTWLTSTADRVHEDSARLLLSPPHWAYLRISEGCSRLCSFCTIPSIRGRFRSKPLDIILKEARQLADFGAVELDLIAQDSTSWGKDLGIKNGLVKLLGELEKIQTLCWIRLMYLYPASLDAPLLETVAQSTKVLPYFDMPIQHISNDILTAMRRSDTEQHTRQIIQDIRRRIPEAVLRTTVIVGFPGETDRQFEQLLEFIQWARFDALGAFPYFSESGTPAADLPGQIPDQIKQQRLEHLMLAQQRIAFEKADTLKDKSLEVLVDTPPDGRQAEGRYWGQAPEIDAICRIDNCTGSPGKLIPTRVTGRRDYDLLVEQIPE